MAGASIFHIPAFAGARSDHQFGATNATYQKAAENVPLAPLASVESSQVTCREPLSSESFPSLCSFPKLFRHDTPLGNLDPLPIALWARSAGLSARFRVAFLLGPIPNEHPAISLVAEHLEDR